MKTNNFYHIWVKNSTNAEIIGHKKSEDKAFLETPVFRDATDTPCFTSFPTNLAYSRLPLVLFRPGFHATFYG